MPLLTHRSRRLALAVIAGALTLAVVGAAFAGGARKPGAPAPVSTLRMLVGHYRSLTWTFERAAHLRRTASSFSDRRTRDRAYLRWLVDRWTRRAYVARARALGSLDRRFHVRLPQPPALRAALSKRVAYSKRLVLRLRRTDSGHSARSISSARGRSASETLRLWEARSAAAVLLVSRQGLPEPVVPDWLAGAFGCIHHYEGSWTSNTGNGYYGGLQMDLRFQSLYGRDYLKLYGTADRWPPAKQLEVAVRAYRAGRGFWPWPRTARACGLI
jgi:hypothetical protein